MAAEQPRGRGGHQDPAVLLIEHALPGGLGAVHRAHQVNIDHRLEVFDRHLAEAVLDIVAGIVDEDIDLAEGVVGALDDRPAAFRAGHRVMVGHRLAARRADLGDHRVGRRVRAAAACHRTAQIIHHHLGAACGQQQGVAPPQAVAGAGDHGDAAVISNCHVLSSGYWKVSTRKGWPHVTSG